jgi:hypothetical protein
MKTYEEMKERLRDLIMDIEIMGDGDYNDLVYDDGEIVSIDDRMEYINRAMKWMKYLEKIKDDEIKNIINDCDKYFNSFNFKCKRCHEKTRKHNCDWACARYGCCGDVCSSCCCLYEDAMVEQQMYGKYGGLI